MLKVLSPYEKDQVRSIEAWKAERPSVISKVWGRFLSPLTSAVIKVIPNIAIEKVLDFSSSAAVWLTDTKDIQRDADIDSVKSLKDKDLSLSDVLANDVHNWAIGFASAEGAGTGVMGLAGMALDIPTIVTLALRTIHKIGACYGYEVSNKKDRAFILAIMAASGANNAEEKKNALVALKRLTRELSEQADKASDPQIRAAAKQNKKTSVINIQNLSNQLGVHITKRKTLQSIPVVGAVVGASVNAWYIKDVGWAARRAFQERWLFENGKMDIYG